MERPSGTVPDYTQEEHYSESATQTLPRDPLVSVLVNCVMVDLRGCSEELEDTDQGEGKLHFLFFYSS